MLGETLPQTGLLIAEKNSAGHRCAALALPVRTCPCRVRHTGPETHQAVQPSGTFVSVNNALGITLSLLVCRSPILNTSCSSIGKLGAVSMT